MTDLWFLFGAMSVDNGLFNVVKQVNPEFQRIKMIVTEVVGKQEDPPYEKLAAGFLCETDTPRLRVAIRGYLAANFPNPAPVISLYTAAKFCQLWRIQDDRFNFGDVFVKAHAAFSRSKGRVWFPLNETLIAMGASLMDSLVADGFVNSDDELIAEFGLDKQGEELKALQAMLKQVDFSQAYGGLMNAKCWSAVTTKGKETCNEVLYWYEGFKRAVN